MLDFVIAFRKRLMIGLAVVAFITLLACCIWSAVSADKMNNRLDRLERAMNSSKVSEVKEQVSYSIKDMVKRAGRVSGNIHTMDAVSKLKIATDNFSYEFTDMKLSSTRFVCDNDLWYASWYSPYLSPGVEHDIYVRADQEDVHWIYFHVVNTEKEDVSAADCTAFTFGVRGIEDVSVCGFQIGDDIEDIIDELGVPDSFALSDYDVISAATYDYGDFEFNIVCSIARGTVEYLEVKCKNTDGFMNGEWRNM